MPDPKNPFTEVSVTTLAAIYQDGTYQAYDPAAYQRLFQRYREAKGEGDKK